MRSPIRTAEDYANASRKERKVFAKEVAVWDDIREARGTDGGPHASEFRQAYTFNAEVMLAIDGLYRYHADRVAVGIEP